MTSRSGAVRQHSLSFQVGCDFSIYYLHLLFLPLILISPSALFSNLLNIKITLLWCFSYCIIWALIKKKLCSHKTTSVHYDASCCSIIKVWWLKLHFFSSVSLFSHLSFGTLHYSESLDFSLCDTIASDCFWLWNNNHGFVSIYGFLLLSQISKRSLSGLLIKSVCFTCLSNLFM